MNTNNPNMPLAGPGLELRPLNRNELGQAVHEATQRIGSLSMALREVVSVQPIDELAYRQLSAERIATRQTLKIRLGQLEDLKPSLPPTQKWGPWIAGC